MCKVKFSWNQWMFSNPLLANTLLSLRREYTWLFILSLVRSYSHSNMHLIILTLTWSHPRTNVYMQRTHWHSCVEMCAHVSLLQQQHVEYLLQEWERVRLKLRVGVHVCQRMYTGLGNVWQIEIEFFSLLWANVCTQKDENAQMCMCDISQFRRYRINAKRKQLKCAYLWVWVGVSGWMDGWKSLRVWKLNLRICAFVFGYVCISSKRGRVEYDGSNKKRYILMWILITGADFYYSKKGNKTVSYTIRKNARKHNTHYCSIHYNR